MTCVHCQEWFEVWTNVGSPGLNYCPICGHTFSEADLEDMTLEDNDIDEEEE